MIKVDISSLTALERAVLEWDAPSYAAAHGAASIEERLTAYLQRWLDGLVYAAPGLFPDEWEKYAKALPDDERVALIQQRALLYSLLMGEPPPPAA